MKKTNACIVLTALAVALCTGCGNRQQPKTDTSATPVFPKVEAPVMMTDPQAMADFYTLHYWDKFDFTEPLFLAYPEVLEQGFVDYVIILPYASGDLPAESLTKLMRAAEADTAMYRFFVEETEHYLWDPNSPYRNDELFIPVLEQMLSSEYIDEATRVRSEYRLDLATKNRPGSVANDFTYTPASGRAAKMSQIKSEYLVLFFNNPGCTMCAEIIAEMQASPAINRLQAEKRLAVLSVYPDEDLEAWRAYQSHMPDAWINAYDKETVIKEEKLYDLKAIPSLYLLDKDKKVLLKDVNFKEIEEYLIRRME